MIGDIGAEQVQDMVIHVAPVELGNSEHFLIDILFNADGKGDFVLLSNGFASVI